MTARKTLLLRSSVLALLLTLLPACELTEEEIQALEEAFYLDPPGGYAPPVDVQPACFLERFVQPEAEVTRKIDLLFVADTSGSLDEERAGIADGIDGFIAALPPEVDYRVGVMFGHGSKSNLAGRLYKKKSDEPLVLKSSELTVGELRTHLKRKLTQTVEDLYADGGEENFYSLWRALDPDRLPESRAAGFFREDAALAVVFISDENEICSDYPAGVTPVRDPEGREDSAKARDCAGINPATVLAKLKALQGDRPLLVGGIVYNRHETVVRSGENEYGYGYMELIQLANGISVDLADPHYQEGLNQIGTLASIRMQFIVDYTLARTEIDTDTLRVEIDGLEAPFQYNSGVNVVHLDDPGRPRSVVDIHYCLRTTPPDGGDNGGGEQGGGDNGGDDGGDTGGGEDGGGDSGGGPQCTGLDCGVFGV